MFDRLGSPFSGSPAMADAYNNASYMRLYMGLAYDLTSGDITCSLEPRVDERKQTGSPGEILTIESVYQSLLVGDGNGLDAGARLINLGFMLGVLSQGVEG